METLRLAAISLFLVAAFGFFLAGLLGGRVKKISIAGADLSPFTTPGARAAALVLGLVVLVPALVLSTVPNPPPPPPPSQAAASSSATPTASPTIEPTASPVASPSRTPKPSPKTSPSPSVPPPSAAEWALDKRDELEVLGVFLGQPRGATQSAQKGWSVQGFASGIVYRKPDETAVAIRGPIYDRWKLIGVSTKPAPNIGYPRGDQTASDEVHPWQRFDDGVIQCTNDACYLVFGEVYTQWRAHQAALGYPIADVEVKLLARRGRFEHGTVVIDIPGQVTICGSDGSTIVGGPISCGSGPPVLN